jgi:dipeptidyl aminopeptidase/acylaminoacyl peptidase
LAAPIVTAQTSPLTIEQIMQEPASWIGDWPEDIRWGEDGQALYFEWNPEGQFPSDSLYKVTRDGSSAVKVPPEERRQHKPFFDGWHHGEHVYDADFQRKVYAQDGDLFLYDRAADAVTRLTDTRASESSPRFDPDGERVLFRQEDNLFAIHLASGQLRQLTDLRSGEEPPEPEPSAQEAFLEEQQLELFETIREQQEEEEQREAAEEREQAADNPPPTYYYGEQGLQQLRIDPSERFVSFTLNTPGDADQTQVIDYVTETGYADIRASRPKVGDERGVASLHVQDLQRDTTYQIDLHQLPGAYDIPEYMQEQGIELDSTEAKRDLYAFGPYWSGSGQHAVVEVRARDNKDRWIARLDAASGDLAVLDRQHDEAWIAGPGISWYGGPSDMGWLPESGTDGERFYFQSEATGYSHLYTVNVATGEVAQLTSGDFEVFDPRLSQDGQTWTFRSSEVAPYERHAYQMPVEGGTPTQLTAEAGWYDAVALSPDGEMMGMLYEYTNQPPEVYLKPTPTGGTNGQAARRITNSPTEEWSAYDWRDPDIIRFEASDGVQVPAQLFEPETPNGAAVLFVHGAGYLQNVHRGWSSYFREYMFHNMLTDLGYTVMNVDYRGSAGYGRDWRTAIYRHMGGRDLQDYVDAQRFLEETRGISGDRTYIYGGSYGGFITLMALFTEAEHFAGGSALRSVTDWAHYNDPYTSNILNTPQTDSLAYARSSPIYFAEGLEDPLLMPHGLVDTNVQPQDIFRLTQRLIELGKEDWELAIYPVEGHGFTEPSSWTDEYRRIFELAQQTVGPLRGEPARDATGEQ